MSKNNKPVNIVVHINEELQQEQIDMLETSLGSDAGIKEVRVNRKRKHLMLVDYDPQDIAALDLLGKVRSHGVHAEPLTFGLKLARWASSRGVGLTRR